MNTIRAIGCSAILLLAPTVYAVETATELDLRRGVPASAHLAVHDLHNPERDYQKQYFAEVWNTLEQEKLGERLLKIVTSRMDEDQLTKANTVVDELREAASPVSWSLFDNCREAVYGQKFISPTNHHVVLLRMDSDGAERLESAAKNLMALVEKYTEGKIGVNTFSVVDAQVTSLALPSDVPFSPVVARIDNVFVLASSPAFIEESLHSLQSSSGESKFDDPRFQAVLADLPQAEDSLTIFDAGKMFSDMRGLGDFLRQQGANNGEPNPKLERIASLMEVAFDELSVPDYEVTVEYTEGYRNHTDVAGKWLEGSEETLLGALLLGGEPFEDWDKWVPEDAVSYSLSTGVRLHPFYERLMTLVDQHVPEAREPLERFEAFQAKIGVHLDRDILQSFSGESVSITLPATDAAGNPKHDSVWALRCTNSERVHELLHRAVDKLKTFPPVQAQQLRLEPCEDLAGFEKLEATIFQMFNVQPVIGFQDGWMFLGSSESAIQRVLDVRSGTAPTIATSDHFQHFGLEVEGPVTSLSYSNMAESTRHAAQMIRQVGLIAPMVIGMAGAQADPEDLKPVQEIVALLPSVANVVEKFDFYEQKLTVVQAGSEPGSYTKQSVTMIRPPNAGE